MPIRLSNRRGFTWRETDDGQPIATCARFGDVVYVLICPACGGFHQVMSKVTGDSFEIEANCLLPKLAGPPKKNSSNTWRRVYDQWLARYPQAAAVTTMRGELLADHEAIGRYCNNPDIRPHAPAPNVLAYDERRQREIEKKQANEKRRKKAA